MMQDEKALVAQASATFQRYKDLLDKCRKGGTAKGAERRAALREYEAVMAELQPVGEWAMAQVRAVLEKIRAAVAMPAGYRMRMNEEGRLFIAGDINTPSDISLFGGNPAIPLDDPNQFGFEVRVFLDSPRLIVFFTVGEQHSFKGRRIDIFPDGPRLKCETFTDLADKTIVALKAAIEAAGFQPS